MRQLRKLRVPAALAAAAATVTLTAGAASASPAYHHHSVPPAVVASYGWSKVKIGHHYYESVRLNIAFTGPQGQWTASFRSPRREALLDFGFQTDESSALGSADLGTKYTPLTITGDPDEYEYTGGILPAGQTATGWVTFLLPMGTSLPRVAVQASTSPYPGSGPDGGPIPGT